MEAGPDDQPVWFGIKADVWAGWLRHGLGFSAGFLAEHGIAVGLRTDEKALEILTAIGVAVVALTWSAVQKTRKVP